MDKSSYTGLSLTRDSKSLFFRLLEKAGTGDLPAKDADEPFHASVSFRLTHESWRGLPSQENDLGLEVIAHVLTCASPSTAPVRPAALRESLRLPLGLPPGLPKQVLSLCSRTPPCDFSLIF